MKITSFATVVLLIISILPSAANAQEKGEFRIRAGKVELEPEDGERAAIPRNRKHAIIQFYRIPSELMKSRLAERGITLGNYLGGNAYIAELAEGSTAISGLEGIRATVGIKPRMKRSSLFGVDKFRDARRAGAPIRTHVIFRKGTDFAEARAILAAAGIEVQQEDFYFNGLVRIDASWDAVKAITYADAVAWAEPFPLKLKSLNIDARKRVRAQAVYNQAAYKYTTGQGIRAGVWDEGPIYRHAEFANRLIVAQSEESASDHSTHVGGIIGSSGNNVPRSTGMAGAVTLVSYDYFDDVWSEMATAKNLYNIRISNNSWGYVQGWEEDQDEDTEEYFWRWYGDYYFGLYTTISAELDTLVYEYDLPVIFAAGNDRNDFYLGPHRNDDEEDETEYEDLHPADPDHGALLTPSTAKNAIIVGALNKDDVLADFSNTGPTNDGRIKPDITAPGVNLYSTLTGGDYDSYSGTSMATPVITGVCCLLIDQYEAYFGARMGSDLLKAILLHSARDLGRAGPDYDYGFGVADVEMASIVLGSAIQNAATASAAAGRQPFNLYARYYEAGIADQAQTSYSFWVPAGSAEMRATIVWNDPEAQYESGTLINDLDIWAVNPNGVTVRPFILYKNNPTAVAGRGINTLDNVEHIRESSPLSGEWTIYVKGTSVPQGPQAYALVLSAGTGNTAPEQKTTGTFSIQEFFATSDISLTDAAAKNSFTDGDTFYGFAKIYVPINADYGYFKGTMTTKWYIRNASGGEVMLYNDTSDSVAGRENVYRWRTEKYEIPSGMGAGTYTLQIIVTMHNGQSATASYSFTVQ